MQIELIDVSYRYDFFGKKSGFALKNIDLTISDGEFLALVGPSGSGKTTLMQHLTGLLKPESGTIRIDGKDMSRGKSDFSAIRRNIGLVFQFPEKQLFEETVFADVAFGPENLGLDDSEIDRRVHQAIEFVGLDFDSFKDRIPFHLSEGEKRRVAIAGVLAMEPEMLVLDEPTAGLDRDGIEAVKSVLRQYHDSGKSVLLISHDLGLVCEVVDRVVLMNRGDLLFDGKKEDLFTNPDLLESAGLRLPRILHVAAGLHKAGLLEKGGYFSTDEIKNAISKKIGKNRNSDQVFRNKPVVEK